MPKLDSIFSDQQKEIDRAEAEARFGFLKATDYAHHLCEAASPDGYGMYEEIITSLVQWIGDTYGEEAAGKAVGFVTYEWDI